MSKRSRRAVTLLEVVIVAALIAVASLLLIPNLGGQEGSAEDATAQVLADTVIGAQQDALNRGVLLNPAEAPELAQLKERRGDADYVAGTSVSTGPTVASVAVAGEGSDPKVGVAVWAEASGTCWMTRRAFLGDPTRPVLYAAGSNPSSCTGDTAINITPETGSRGVRWGLPQILS